jgi:hypothetical protein
VVPLSGFGVKRCPATSIVKIPSSVETVQASVVIRCSDLAQAARQVGSFLTVDRAALLSERRRCAAAASHDGQSEHDTPPGDAPLQHRSARVGR